MFRGLITISLLVTAAAPYNNGLSGWGETSLKELDDDVRDAVIKANHNPTTTRSVKFKALEKYWSSLPEGSALRNSEWEWRINTSDVATPDVSQTGLIDPHVVSTIHDLTWPRGDNISEALDGATSTLCMGAVSSMDLPVSVLNGYTEETANSTSCLPTLGQDCIDAILQRGAIRASANGSYCGSPLQPWNQLSACKDSLGKVAGYGASFSGYSLSGINTQNNVTRQAWTNGQGFLFDVSRNLNGSLSNEYLEAVNQLHIFMFDARILTGNGGDYIGGPELHCMRVNATKLPTRDTDGDGVAMTSENLRSLGTSLDRPISSFSIVITIVTVALIGVL